MHRAFQDADLELKVCRDAALVIPAFTIASSPVNKTKDPHSILVRIQEIPEPLYPPTLEKVYTTILLQFCSFHFFSGHFTYYRRDFHLLRNY